jgi:hypothetical protein
MPMELQSISISRATYGVNKGQFEAKAVIKGGSTYPADITIPIADDMLTPIVGILAQAVAETMAESAKQFAADVAGSLTGPALDNAALAAPVAEDEIPY